jgi:hypothetical protein
MTTVEIDLNVCDQCGTLFQDGWPGMTSIELGEEERVRDLSRYEALVAEHQHVSAELARARGAHESALDEDAKLHAQRRIVPLEERLATLEPLLTVTPRPRDAQPDGPCPGCGLEFRGGRVDRRRLAERDQERANTLRYLDAMREERHATEVALRLVDRNRTWADMGGKPRPASVVQREIAEKRERKTKYLAGVTAQIDHMSAHLASLEFRPHPAKPRKGRGATVEAGSAPAARAERR